MSRDLAQAAQAPTQSADADVRATRERIERADAAGPLEVRRAYAVLSGLLRDLPETDSLMLGQEAVGAWRVLQNFDPEIYVAYRSAVRARVGRHITDLIDHLVGPPRKSFGRAIELLSPEELELRDFPPWIIRGVLPASGTAAIIGDSAAGKTSFALDVGLHIALDRAWRGRRVRQGGVVYVAAEGVMRARLAAFARHHKVSLAGAPIRVIEQQVALGGPDSDLRQVIDKVAAAREALGEIRLVFIDTLARTFNGSESDAADMGVYIACVGALAQELNCLVAVLHHVGKDQSRGARGHSSLRAAVDAELLIERESSGRRVAKVTKLRDAADGETFPFTLHAVDLGPHPDPAAEAGERWGACVVVPNDDPVVAEIKAKRLAAGAQVALDALRTAISLHGELVPRTSVIPAGRRAVRAAQWQDVYASMRPLPAGLDDGETTRARNARRMALQRAQEQLQAARAVGTWNSLWWLA